ncbi:MAG: 16S rRNA (cytidine(1402)-2'-O)-methyltransferase [Pacificimonas sp.]
MDENRLPPGLYIVATPIGNLNDLSFRAGNILQRADAIAAEDSRVTGKLLKHIGARAPLIRYHEHNAAEARPRILKRAVSEAIALVTDAGTPLISDPGYKLVAGAQAQGVAVTSIPGPCAAIVGLTLAGLPTDRFLFAGFLPVKDKARRDALAELSEIRATLVLFESGPRLAKALASAADVLGRRDAAVTRELTKLHEEVRRAPLPDLAAHYAEAGAPKGENVLVIAPPDPPAPASADDLDSALRKALETDTLKSAVRQVTDRLGLPRADVYARALALKDE